MCLGGCLQKLKKQQNPLNNSQISKTPLKRTDLGERNSFKGVFADLKTAFLDLGVCWGELRRKLQNQQKPVKRLPNQQNPLERIDLGERSSFKVVFAGLEIARGCVS